ncbi:MAG: PIN domain-containing protein [Chloroflexi bacterium]|nr:PIN domain-containing protein [Chloroflexota bacterium]
MIVFDTNVLVYAANESSEFHDDCRSSLIRAREDPTPAYLSWNVCYEFLRVLTDLRAHPEPRTAEDAWSFLSGLLDSPGFSLLTPTPRHAAVLGRTLAELPNIRGLRMHDLHTAVLMREHGISRICTRDKDFRQFPFLDVVDPLG